MKKFGILEIRDGFHFGSKNIIGLSFDSHYLMLIVEDKFNAGF